MLWEVQIELEGRSQNPAGIHGRAGERCGGAPPEFHASVPSIPILCSLFLLWNRNLSITMMMQRREGRAGGRNRGLRFSHHPGTLVRTEERSLSHAVPDGGVARLMRMGRLSITASAAPRTLGPEASRFTSNHLPDLRASAVSTVCWCVKRSHRGYMTAGFLAWRTFFAL